MTDTWKHPSIAEFERGQFGWCFSAPSFWSGVFPHCNEPSISVEIEFSDHEEVEPAYQAVEQLTAFWAAKDDAPSAICDYLWSEIQGDIPSKNWWSWMEQDQWEDLVEVRGCDSPNSEQDLLEHLIIPAVSVRHFPEETGEQLAINPFTGEKIENPKPPSPSRPAFWAVEVAFRCLWEEEHGIAAFWRNGEIIGTDLGDGQGVPPDDYIP